MGIRKTYYGNAEEILDNKRGNNLDLVIRELEQGHIQGLKGKGPEFQKEVLGRNGWSTEKFIGIPGRRYSYDGFKDGIALEIEWTQVERVLADLLKLEYGFINHMIDVGIIVTIGDRSTRSPIAIDESGGEKEIEEFQKSIITIPILLVVLMNEV